MLTKHSPERLASRFINGTCRHVFLTGRAGTGKTTFLRALVEQTHKKVVVAAPTGIAAINAGGVTLHSLLHLPFGAFLPTDAGLDQYHITTQVNTPRSLVRHIRMHDTKRRMIREMELLVIDEVSMLRADLLDAIDLVLRHIRRRRSDAFGGVQMLFIGDMLQLPPVVKHEEWQLLRHHYPGMYFFQAQVLRGQPPVCLELEKVYRQSDPRFIGLLNKLRDANPSHEETALLNAHVDPSYDPVQADRGIFLTTHNQKADRINEQAIARIDTPATIFRAVVTGDFSESQYPVEEPLTLKEDARVMFIKNDHTGERRYFNGKIGTVDELADDYIAVRFDDGSPLALVERYTWENKKFNLNKESNEIEEKVAGTFSQYPLRLAWAITIHKSQGLTFDRAVIDVSAAFAPGQVYVALSRLTGLEGLTLTAPLPQRSPGPDEDLMQFSQERASGDDITGLLRSGMLQYIHRQLLAAFDFSALADDCKLFLGTYNKEEGRSAKQRYRPWAAELHDAAIPLREVGDRFLRQMRSLPGFSLWDGDGSPRRGGQQTGLAFEEEGAGITGNKEFDVAASDNIAGMHERAAVHADHANPEVALLESVHERVKAATAYFSPLLKELSNKVFTHILSVDGLVGVKGYISELREMEASIFSYQQRMHKMEPLLRAAIDNDEPTRASLADTRLARERKHMLQAVVGGGGGGKGTKRPKGRREGGAGKTGGTLGTKGRRDEGKVRGREGEREGRRDWRDWRDFRDEGTEGGREGVGNPERKLRSAEVSLEMFRQGIALEEIASMRSLAISTVAGHLAWCVGKGLIGVEHFLEKEKRQQIMLAAEAVNSRKPSAIMAVLGDEFSYADVLFALAAEGGVRM